MKLATGTYVKIALIVLLCLGVCGFFGGCGRGGWLPSLIGPGGVVGCVGGSALEGAVNSALGSGTYETTTEGSHFEIDAADIDAIELNWLAGEAAVVVVPDDDTGGKIIVEESVDHGRAPLMACANEGGTLAINYMEGHGGLNGCSVAAHSKRLTVQLPASLGDHLKQLEVEAASGRYTLEGMVCQHLELGVAAGEMNVSGLAADSLGLSLASGRVSVEGAVTGTVNVDQASGDFALTCSEVAPTSLSGSLASGSITANLPAHTAFDLRVDRTSGNFDNQFAEPAGADAPLCKVNFDMLSGNFVLRPIG